MDENVIIIIHVNVSYISFQVTCPHSARLILISMDLQGSTQICLMIMRILI